MTHACVGASGHHWFGEWLATAPNDYLNQCWLIEPCDCCPWLQVGHVGRSRGFTIPQVRFVVLVEGQSQPFFFWMPAWWAIGFFWWPPVKFITMFCSRLSIMNICDYLSALNGGHWTYNCKASTMVVIYSQWHKDLQEFINMVFLCFFFAFAVLRRKCKKKKNIFGATELYHYVKSRLFTNRYQRMCAKPFQTHCIVNCGCQNISQSEPHWKKYTELSRCLLSNQISDFTG